MTSSSFSYRVLNLYETMATELISRLLKSENDEKGTKIGDQTYQIQRAVSLVNTTAVDEILTHIFTFIFKMLQKYISLNSGVLGDQVRRESEANTWEVFDASE